MKYILVFETVSATNAIIILSSKNNVYHFIKNKIYKKTMFSMREQVLVMIKKIIKEINQGTKLYLPRH